MKLHPLFILAFLFSITGNTQSGDKNDGAGRNLLIPSEKVIFYKLGSRTIPIRVIQYGDIKDIVCINLHDNENTSVEAAQSILAVKGGTLLKIENNQQKIVRFRLRGYWYSFDPNGIFSIMGIWKTLKANGNASDQAVDEIEKFSKRLLALIPGKSSCIIALHNNINEGFSIKSYLAGNERQFDARAVYTNNDQDIDDMAITTDSLLYSKMAGYGFNSIWQDNENAKKDGSLSIYFGEKNQRYINIETQHGKREQYIEMLEKLWIILREENIKTFQKEERAQ